MEIYKLLTKKKILLLLLAIYICTLVLFVRQNPALGNYDEEYVTNYSSEIEEILNASDNLNSFSIFNVEDSFSERNIEKTKNDFSKIADINVTKLSGLALENYFRFDEADIAIFIGAVFIALACLDERKKALQCVLHTCSKGRGRLAARRIGTMFFATAFFTLVVKLSLLVTANVKYGGNIISDLSQPVQSVQKYFMLTYSLTIGQFCIVKYLYSVLSCFLAALIVWSFFWIIDNFMAAMGGVLIFGLVEYGLYTWIKTGQGAENLHYCNIFYNCMDARLWSEYKNLNIASSPVDKMFVNLILELALLILTGCVAILVAHFRYPIASRRLGSGRVVQKVTAWYSGVRSGLQEKLSVMMAEFYKLMVSQKGILVAAGIIIALIYINPIPDVKFMGFQEGYNDFIHEYVGEPSEKSEEGLAELQALVDEEDARHMQVLELYDEGKASAQDAATSGMLHSSLEYRRNLLEKLMEQTQYVQSVREYKGIDAWYVNYYEYSNLLEDEKIINMLLLLLSISLISGACVSAEKKTDMGKILHTTYIGRKRMLKNKLLVAGIYSALIYGVMIYLRLAAVWATYKFEGLGAPVQSYPDLAAVSVPISMRAYLILYYLIKMLTVICWADGVVLINMRVDSKLASIVTVVLGAALYILIKTVGYQYAVIPCFVLTLGAIILEQRRWMVSYEISD